MISEHWQGRRFLREVNGAIAKCLEKAAFVVENKAKQSMKARGQSRPGGPPAVQTGMLRRSITHEVHPRKARVGSNVEYARRQELGFVGTDAAGRKVNAPAYPYLRPALDASMSEIKKIFGAR